MIFMTRIFKVKNVIIYFLAIIIIGSIGAWWYATGQKGPEYTTETVTRGKLVQTVEATGKVESVDRIGLNFRISGRISQISVKAGQEVAAGEVLARLDVVALQSRVVDARAMVDKARAKYDELIAGATNEDIQVVKDTVEQKKGDKKTVENTLNNLRAKKETELQNLKETSITVINNEIVVAKAAMDEIKRTLNNSDAEGTLGLENTASVINLQNSRNKANNSISELSDETNGLTVASSDGSILSALDNAKSMLDLVKTALDDMLTVLDYTITSTDLSESELDTLEDNIQSDQTSISASRTSIQTAKTNWTNKISYYEDQEAAAQDAISQAEAAVKVAESQLAAKISPPQLFQINAQKAEIAQAEAALSLALANLDDTVIRAPIPGTITKKNLEAGEQASLSEPVLEMIGRSNLEIEVDIPESDISKIKTAQTAEIDLDAFASDLKFSGIVSFIDPAETLIQDVVYYKVKVQLAEDYAEIKPGMTANVVIFTAQKDDVLSIPFRAVKSRNGDKYVEILVNNQPRERIVQLGLRGDDGVEIIAGLEEGDEVITFVKE